MTVPGGRRGDPLTTQGAAAELAVEGPGQLEDLFENAPCGYLATLPDGTIVMVNGTFLGWTGYRREDLVGRRRLRDLLTPGGRIFHETHYAPLLTMQGYVKELSLDIVCPDGRRLPVLLNAAVQHDAEDRHRLTRVMAFDASDRKQYERELLRAREEAERASEASARAQARLSLRAEASAALMSTLDPEEGLRRFARMLVPALGDYCIAYLAADDERASLVPAGCAHVDQAREHDVRRLAERLPPSLTEASSLRAVLSGGEARLLTGVSAEQVAGATSDPESRGLLAALGVASAIVLPMVARGRLVAVLLAVRARPDQPHTQEEFSDALDLAERGALAIDNNRLYRREHETAVALQHSLLSPLPDIAGLDLCAAYLPGSSTAEVGGDWYDVLALPDGATGLAIGDVMGHDLAAAAAMGQLRSVLRSYAWEGAPPRQVLTRLDRLVQGLGMAQLATCFYARLEPRATGWELVYANAGHHAPLLRLPDGTVHALDGGRGLLIGVQESGHASAPPDARATIPPGSTVLLFTDGLVEDRRRSLDDGVATVSAVLAAHEPATGAAALCEQLTAVVRSTKQEDDVCLLALTVDGP